MVPRKPGDAVSGQHYLTTAEVAAMYRVDPKTVGSWARNGKLECITTPGGRRRFPAEQFAPEMLATTGKEESR